MFSRDNFFWIFLIHCYLNSQMWRTSCILFYSYNNAPKLLFIISPFHIYFTEEPGNNTRVLATWGTDYTEEWGERKQSSWFAYFTILTIWKKQACQWLNKTEACFLTGGAIFPGEAVGAPESFCLIFLSSSICDFHFVLWKATPRSLSYSSCWD